MKIKVCGMRDGENIRHVTALGVEWIGMVFHEGSPRNVTMIPTHAGIIPDRAPATVQGDSQSVQGDLQSVQGDLQSPYPIKRVGVFTDEMAQNIITRVVNFRLDAVQLDGHEPATLVRNLRATLTDAPEGTRAIAPRLQVWKTIAIGSAADLALCKDYEDCCDLFVFSFNPPLSALRPLLDILQAYDGQRPFLLGGDIGPDDAKALRTFSHPQCMGVSLDTRFETAPAVKDVELLRTFIAQLS